MMYCYLSTEIPRREEPYIKTMDAFLKSEGFDTIVFEESVWKRVGGGKYAEDIYLSAHVDH